MFRTKGSIWQDLVIGIVASILSMLLLTTCSDPVAIHLDIRAGTAAKGP